MSGLMTVLMLTGASANNNRSIVSVERVSIETPAGNAPQLPYQLWVKYSDDYGEYRQVKWLNASEATEKAEANPDINPVGTIYKIRGFIIGDNSTTHGYPVSAEVTVVKSDKCKVTSSKPVAETLPLSEVSIDGKNRLTWNRDLDIDQLISLPVKQQLYNYRDTYGLSTEGYPESDGWDSPTTKLKGHGSGHYMSALAMAFASCQDKAKKDILRKNITEMVNGLRQCQEQTFVWNEKLGRYWEARDFAPEEELKEMKGTWADFDRYKKDCRKYGYGYLNAIPAQHCVLIEMYRAYNNENWVWAPYYSVHKQLAGLIDIATYIDDKAVADKALLTAKDMGLWVWNRLHYRTYVKSDGRQDERRARPGNRYEMWNMYIAGEVGGMAESLARLSEMTGTTEEKNRLLEAANYFDSPAFFDPLSKNIDAIRTRHANQHIPMVTGALRSFRGNNNPYYYNLAKNFWTLIQGRYRYAMGGVGNGEMFRQPYSQITSMCTNVTHWGGHEQHEPTMNETCCAYNLAKLTKDLNCYDPDDARYMDYYERVLYNQIIGSVNPRQYQTVYQYAVGLDASKPWGNETPQSTCCGGTGVENHVKYQEAAYFVSDNTIWVALYMPTTAHWKQKGVIIKQDCQWPAERSVIRIQESLAAQFTMKLRVPYWATEGFDIKLNGKSITKTYQPSSYVEIPSRQWKVGDVVEVVMPFTRHVDFGPDKQEGHWVGAFMRGPLVMAATGIKTWDEATVDVNHDLSNFIPDYDGDQHLTHYFRINLPDTPSANLVGNDAVDKSQLRELLLIAKIRCDEQQAWNALTVKVPEYAPWAIHGFTRMQQQYAKAQPYMDAPVNRYTQEEIDNVASSLNAIINTMRPGNLPELEDLHELQQLLEQAKKLPKDNEQTNRAISYAGMVIRYVSDGSGTMDMIQRATKQLKEVLDSVSVKDESIITKESYLRAFAVREKYSGKVKNGDVAVHVKHGEHKFWYSVSDGSRQMFKEIDAERQTVTLLPGNPEPPKEHKQNEPKHHWMEVPDEKDGIQTSPDGKLQVFYRAGNLWVTHDGQSRPLTTNGDSAYYYSAWGTFSPDSRYFATVRIKPAPKHYVYYVESSPKNRLEPLLHKQEYAKPGDSLNYRVPVIIEMSTGRVVEPSTELFSQQYYVSAPKWDADGEHVTFEFNERGHKTFRVLELSAKTGKVRCLIEEKNDKYINYNRQFRYDFKNGKYILWTSERDGHNHIYLYDRHTGHLVRQVTHGEYYVREIQHVDEKRGIIYFSANGHTGLRLSDRQHTIEDPYLIHYYKVELSGHRLTCLTPEEGNHQVTYTDDMAYLVDTYSTITTPPVCVLRSGKDGRVLKTIETADISSLEAEGWKAPEVFVAKGRDGVTDMWGIIVRPTTFDPSKKYPVIEYIYSGPGDQYVPKSFRPWLWGMAELAELGFIVVQVDAMTTSFRSRAFEEVCYKNLSDAGLPDRKAWIRAAAEKYSYMDIERVGIYGCSAGGQNALTAVLQHGDFYKAAYAACGCHDNRMDKIWWNEQWMGYPVDSSYVASSNVENAHLLERPLMLVVGELDDNVDPASTMQVVNALEKAGKDFDLVVITGAQHTMGEHFGDHKRYDFFVRHLQGTTPPKWNELRN